MSRIDATQAFLRLKGCLGLSPNMFEVAGEVLGCRESVDSLSMKMMACIPVFIISKNCKRNSYAIMRSKIEFYDKLG